MTLHPTGKHNGGVAGSNAEVRHDLTELNKRKACYDQAADENCVQASVIAAIASRESRGGSLLYSTNGYGDHGHGWGIMQCDLYTSGMNCKSCAWDSCCHIRMMVREKLVPDIKTIQRKQSSWSKAQQQQGAVTAYNSGTGNVQTWSRLDIGTTGNDYSNDVMARAQYLHNHGWN